MSPVGAKRTSSVKNCRFVQLIRNGRKRFHFATDRESAESLSVRLGGRIKRTKVLDITVPPMVIAHADQVIE
jgi:hypothetical protein